MPIDLIGIEVKSVSKREVIDGFRNRQAQGWAAVVRALRWAPVEQYIFRTGMKRKLYWHKTRIHQQVNPGFTFYFEY